MNLIEIMKVILCRYIKSFYKIELHDIDVNHFRRRISPETIISSNFSYTTFILITCKLMKLN